MNNIIITPGSKGFENAEVTIKNVNLPLLEKQRKAYLHFTPGNSKYKDEITGLENFLNEICDAWFHQKDEPAKYPETISLVWSIGDFEGKAQELEGVYPDEGDQYTDETPMLYDRSKFGEALQLMERRHDCNYGVTWETVEYFLDEYCRL